MKGALELASQGCPVFPCRADDKKPYTTHGYKDASADPHFINFWWRRWPDALVGVPCNKKFTVVDCDTVKHPEAARWYAYANFPITRTHITRSGGRHLIFQPHADVWNSESKIHKGVDSRGDGGYIVWWPAHGYQVLHPDVLAPVPEFILKALAREANVARTHHLPIDPDTAPAKIAGIIRTIAGARKGERQSVCFWGACRLAELALEQVITRDQVIDIAVEAASRCGLEHTRARSAALSALRTVK
jgi:putative DNA primase/helicase